MFRFEKDVSDTVAEMNDIDKHHPYDKIESSDGFSVEDSMSFWDDELNAKYQECEEKYLTEINNRSEDEFDYNIEVDDELKDYVSKFESENWSQMTDGEKKDAIKDTMSHIAKDLDLITIPKLKFYKDGVGPDGYYNSYNNHLNINIEKTFLSDSKELLNTLVHELRHAFQHERANMLETKEDALFRCNIDNYIVPEKSFYAYESQYVEVDARAYADAFIKSYEEAAI